LTFLWPQPHVSLVDHWRGYTGTHLKEMTCGHCEAAVQSAVKPDAAQAAVVAERMQACVLVAGEVNVERVEGAIRDLKRSWHL